VMLADMVQVRLQSVLTDTTEFSDQHSDSTGNCLLGAIRVMQYRL
jgi:hypothetical protein